jgi:hypothetical protein
MNLTNLTQTNKDQKNNFIQNAVITTTTACGALYGITGGKTKFVSEKRFARLEQLTPTADEFFLNYSKCFNMEKAKEALQNDKISQELFEAVRNIRRAAIARLKNERAVRDIANKPFDQRKMTYKEAVKKANESAINFAKKNFNIAGMQQKLVETGILDLEKYSKLMKEGQAKAKQVFKIIAAPTAASIAVFSGIGLLAGIGINKLLWKNSNKQASE